MKKEHIEVLNYLCANTSTGDDRSIDFNEIARGLNIEKSILLQHLRYLFNLKYCSLRRGMEGDTDFFTMGDYFITDTGINAVLSDEAGKAREKKDDGRRRFDNIKFWLSLVISIFALTISFYNLFKYCI